MGSVMNGGYERPEIDRQQCRAAIRIAGGGHRQSDHFSDRMSKVYREARSAAGAKAGWQMANVADYWPEE